MNPVKFPPGFARLLTNPIPTGSGRFVKTIGTLLASLRIAKSLQSSGNDHVWRGPRNLRYNSLGPFGTSSAPIGFKYDVLTINPTELAEVVTKGI